MADVRLTATNPEDSSVVPVACDASGRLLLEEPQLVEGPPGPPGPQGDPGVDGKDGDPFSGNFAGDVTFDGSAEFASSITAGDFITSGAFQFLDNGDATARLIKTVNNNKEHSAFILKGDPVINSSDISTYAVQIFRGGNKPEDVNCKIGYDGSAEFAGTIMAGNATPSTSYLRYSPGVNNLQIRNTSGQPTLLFYADSVPTPVVLVTKDGSAQFAGGKAGFTAEGYLWCTTRRGDTVILDATSNGIGSWVEYTPTSRIDDLRDRLDAKRPDTGEMPADTP